MPLGSTAANLAGLRLPGVQIVGEAMIFASAEINGRDRLAFRRECSAQQLHLPVVVDVFTGRPQEPGKESGLQPQRDSAPT
jgi:hypothetical protein